MSRDIQTMSDLQRGILQFLLSGWQTVDDVKDAAFVSLTELAGRFGVPPEQMRQELALLESLGYVENVHSYGVDQTIVYKRIEDEGEPPVDPDDPTYFLSENGKTMLIAEMLRREGDTASPA